MADLGETPLILGKKRRNHRKGKSRQDKQSKPLPPPRPLLSSRSGSAKVLLVERGAFIESNDNNYDFCIWKNKIGHEKTIDEPKLFPVRVQCDGNHCLILALFWLNARKLSWDSSSEGSIVPCMSVALASIISVLPCFMLVAKLFRRFFYTKSTWSYRPLTKMPQPDPRIHLHSSVSLTATVSTKAFIPKYAQCCA